MLAPLLALCLSLIATEAERITSKKVPPPDLLRWAIPLTLEGYTEHVDQVAHSPKGRIIATVGRDRVTRLWKEATGKELCRLEGMTGKVLGLRFSPDSKFIAMAWADQSIHLWETATGKKILYLPAGILPYSRIVHASNGTRIGISSYQGQTRLWDTSSELDWCRFTFHRSHFHDTLFKPDDLRLLSEAGSDSKIWNDRTGKLLFECERQEVVEDPLFWVRTALGCEEDDFEAPFITPAAAKRMAVNEGGQCAATIDPRGNVRVWNGTKAWRFESPTGEIQHIGFLDDGQFFLLKANRDKTITIWYLSCD